MHAGGFPKGGLSHCKRPPFTVQKTVFHKLKGRLSVNTRLLSVYNVVELPLTILELAIQ